MCTCSPSVEREREGVRSIYMVGGDKITGKTGLRSTILVIDDEVLKRRH